MAATGRRARASLRRAADEPLWRLALAARLVAPWRRRRFHRFGEGAIVHRPAWLYGTRWIAVGDQVLVHRGAWLAVERQAWGAQGPVVVIGDRVAIRTNCTISAAAGIEIGDDVVFGGSVTLVDSDHTWDDGHPNVLYNRVEADPIRIGRGTWIGDHVTVLRGATVGAFCMIGANSVVRGDIPDGSVAVGAPARVVGRTRHPPLGPDGA